MCKVYVLLRKNIPSMCFGESILLIFLVLFGVFSLYNRKTFAVILWYGVGIRQKSACLHGTIWRYAYSSSSLIELFLMGVIGLFNLEYFMQN